MGTMTVCCPRLLSVSRCMHVWSVREAQWLGSGVTAGRSIACGQSWVYVLCDLWVGEGVCPCGHHDGVLSPTAVCFPMHACMKCARRVAAGLWSHCGLRHSVWPDMVCLVRVCYLFVDVPGEGPCGYYDGVLSPTAVRFPMYACMLCARHVVAW